MGRNKSTNDLTNMEIAVIKSLAQNGLIRAKVARELHYSYNSIDYFVDRIKTKTELDPLDFYEMIKLIEMVKDGERID